MSSVSVIIPSYNRALIIGETIENMLSQSLKPYEIIVVDDGSTDNSIEVIKSFGDKVKLIQQTNKGPGAARNAGLKIASGTFIQFMDSDDMASLNKLEVQVATLTAQKADIVYGPWVKVWINEKKIKLEDVVLQQYALPNSRSPLGWILTDWSMVFQQCLVRKSLLLSIDGYREDMRLFEDGDLFVRLLLAKAKMVFESESLTFYRNNDHGKLTASGQPNVQRALDQAKFYSGILHLANQDKILQENLHATSFKMNIWNAVKDLEKSGTLDLIQHLSLIEFAKKPEYFKNYMLFIRNKRGGLRKRLKGHRWPKCFQAGQLTNHQIRLIKELGWQISK